MFEDVILHNQRLVVKNEETFRELDAAESCLREPPRFYVNGDPCYGSDTELLEVPGASVLEPNVSHEPDLPEQNLNRPPRGIEFHKEAEADGDGRWAD